MENDLRQNTSVSIDGDVVRQIREDKRLTQLYVAKVVGVTTDTVSRWENNRYPTMRRDNALKLAEALEVPLEEILKPEEGGEEVPPEAPVRPLWRRLLPLFIVVLALFGMALLSVRQPGQAIQLDAQRFLPPYAAPGSQILVRVHLDAKTQLKGMILREQFPTGWSLVAAEPPASSVDNEIGKARWIFRNPQLQTRVSYLLQVPVDATPSTAVELSGEVITNPDGHAASLSPRNVGKMQVQPLHWADSNGNSVIDDVEILDVSYLLDETGPLPLGWDRLELLWDAGGYRWDAQSAEFVPVVPENAEKPVSE